MSATCLATDNPICAGVQRESRHSYKYPNGSEVVVGGMDRPGKILSAEYDLIVSGRGGAIYGRGLGNVRDA